jgi:hypothetical protein
MISAVGGAVKGGTAGQPQQLNLMGTVASGVQQEVSYAEQQPTIENDQTQISVGAG